MGVNNSHCVKECDGKDTHKEEAGTNDDVNEYMERSHDNDKCETP